MAFVEHRVETRHHWIGMQHPAVTQTGKGGDTAVPPEEVQTTLVHDLKCVMQPFYTLRWPAVGPQTSYCAFSKKTYRGCSGTCRFRPVRAEKALEAHLDAVRPGPHTPGTLARRSLRRKHILLIHSTLRQGFSVMPSPPSSPAAYRWARTCSIPSACRSQVQCLPTSEGGGVSPLCSVAVMLLLALLMGAPLALAGPSSLRRVQGEEGRNTY